MSDKSKAKTIDDSEIDAAVLQSAPLSFVRKNMALPLRIEDGRLVVAVVSYGSLLAVDELSRRLGLPAAPALYPPEAINDAANRWYARTSGSAQQVVSELDEDDLEALAHEWEEPKDLLELTEEAPMIRLLNSILFQAVKERSTDVHVEPYERKLDVRFRRDGILYGVLTPPKVVQDALISRIKIMAGLDIAEKRLPQDGRIRLLVAGRDIDVRVSVIPTSFGERAVMRLLDRRVGAVDLNGLGLDERHSAMMEGLLRRGSGIILSTGPTGSGKTTTMYAALNRINLRERNVITIEDPVEYQLDGVGQMQVNVKAGLTFANGLRSILRQDPDVIMVGEIRDPETAEIAIQASLTGHLVLSTLHTNDAPSAITRLIDMGVQPFLLASSLEAVIAQRLVRVLCRECMQEYPAPDGVAAAFVESGFDPAPATLWRPAGCPECLQTGYRGQIGIFEFMQADPDMRSLMLKSADSATLRTLAVSKGMKTLRRDGLEKAALGTTSVEEVFRVLGG